MAAQTALASSPKLHLYSDIFEGTGLKKYLCCPGDSKPARIRFQFRCGTSFLREATGRRDVEAYEENFDLLEDSEQHPQHCLHCTSAPTVESVEHVMTECQLYNTIRVELHTSLQQLCPTAYEAFRQCDGRSQTVQLLRDDFWKSALPYDNAHAATALVNTYLKKLMDIRDKACMNTE